MVRLIWLHGLGTVLVGAAGWFLFAFLADWLLHVPAPVRLLHTVVLVALPAYLFRRELLGHLGKIPGPAGLAQLLERRHPESADLLVSAVQLGRTLDEPDAPDMPGRSELVRRLVDRAERLAGELRPEEALDPRRPGRRALAGAGSLALVALLAILQPALFSIFVQRMFGAPVSWPQRTNLFVEVPLAQELGTIESLAPDEERTGPVELKVARGTDVPVLVTAEGVVPDEVTLHFGSGKEVRIPGSGRGLFRTAITSAQEDMEFWVTGGDDLDGEPRFRLTVLQPPDVSGLAISIAPPPYSGLPARLERGPDVEVLAGSRLTVYVEPDPSDASGNARLLPADEVLALEPASMPAFPGLTETGLAETGSAETGTGGASALSFSFEATESLRYRFELRDSTGLPNPDPGLYAVTVRADRRPEVVLLSPGRAEVPVVPGGALPLRVRVEDDHGLGELSWSTRSDGAGQQDPPLRRVVLEPRTLPAPEGGVRGVASTRLEVDLLTGEGSVAEGTVLVLQVEATDNRTPEAGESLSTPVRLRVVSADDLQRRLQDDLARAGEQAGRLQRLEEDRLARAREALAALSTDDLEDGGELASPLLSGLRRIEGDSRALARNLAAIAESLLYARLDERAAPLLAQLEEGFADITDRSFHPEPWRELATAYDAGGLGQAALAGQLVEIVGLALQISEEQGPASTGAMQEATQLSDPTALRSALELSIASQEAAIATTDRLLELLAEWDNFNSVLTLTRDILNRQKNLTEQTRQHAKNK